MAPDVLATVDTLIAEADMVAARVTWRGTHPPAGTHIEGHTMHGFRIEQDHIVEQWSAGWDWRWRPSMASNDRLTSWLPPPEVWPWTGSPTSSGLNRSVRP